MGSLLLAYVLGELIIYTAYHDRLVLFPRYVTDATYGSFKIRRNVPKAHYVHKSYDGRWEFFINGEGFRSKKELNYDKPPGTIRIMTLGDSFTIGYEVQQEETYSAILEKYLRGKGYPVEVINTGVSGFGTAEELIFFQEEGLKYHPDVVILGFYENDLTDNIRSDLFRLVNDQPVLHKKEYLPAIKTRNFLNSFFLYRWLSEHSYFHNYLNNVLTILMKEEETQKYVKEIGKSSNPNLPDYENKLAIALVKQIYSLARQYKIYFILLDIPSSNLSPSFPRMTFLGKPPVCDLYVNAASVLTDFQGLTDLYRRQGHNHWSAFSHLLMGKKIGEILEKEFFKVHKR